MMWLTKKFILLVIFAALLLVIWAGKVINYIITERAKITHMNTKYMSFVNISVKRHGRRSTLYYVDIHYDQLVPFDDSIRADFYFYEFLSNEYRRGFVEMHFGFCKLVHEDPFFGAAMNQGKLRQPCPFPPGDYHLYNMSIPSAAIPPGFPFTKGRIYANFTQRGIPVVGGYIDMELKEKVIKSKSKKKK